MHLKRVTLKNFRCFESLVIDLHPRLTVLVAENGGGKTAILDGIATGLSPILRYLSTANQRLSGPGIADTDFRLVPAQGRSGDDRWVAGDYAQVVVEAEDLKWDVWRASAPNKQPQEKVGQNALSDYLSTVLEGLKASPPAPAPLPVFAYYGARRGWVDVPARLRESKIDYGYPTSALVGALASLSDFKEMLKWFDDAETLELRANRDSSPDDWQDYPPLSAVRSVLESALVNAYRNPHFNKRHKFVVESMVNGTMLQVAQLSQGYQSMLALCMDFARRLVVANEQYFNTATMDSTQTEQRVIGAISPFDIPRLPAWGPLWAPAVMLVDEIDLHLHPSWQQRVIGDLMLMFPDTQFIVTTHSPQVLSTVPSESIRLIEIVGDNAVLKQPAEQTKGTESASVLASVMGIDPVPPVEEAVLLSRYRQLIQLRQHGTDEGAGMRSKLEAHFGAKHPLIQDCDRLIRLEQFKAQLSNVPAGKSIGE